MLRRNRIVSPAFAPLLAGCLLVGCAWPGADERAVFTGPSGNRGPEAYSAWFGDTDGRVVYFGLSPFWSLWWANDGDPRADLREPGDHVIGRFDLAARRFLAPLRVRAMREDVRSSVWDVLVHSDGRVWYTTYFEEIGHVDPRTGDVVHLTDVGRGFNELAEGPGGNVYVTRYSDLPEDATRQRYGALVVIGRDGRLVRETRFDVAPDGTFTAPKSVAVHPRTGEVWLNADVFHPDGSITFDALHLDPDGTLLERRQGAPELLFMRYDAQGRGWFVEDHAGVLRLSITNGNDLLAWLDIGPRDPLDFAQDLHFAPDGSAAIAFWSGRVVVVAERQGELRATTVQLPRPDACQPPKGRSIFYSAFLHGRDVWATLFCGPTLTRTPLPN